MNVPTLRWLLASLLILPLCRAASDVSVIDGVTLQMPQLGDHGLHILDSTTLELKRINTKAPDPATVDSWNFVSNGSFTAPATTKFTVQVNGANVGVSSVGFKRRPLYAPLKIRDLRIDNSLYLRVNSSIADGATVTVTNPDGTLWPASMVFTAAKSPLRYSPAIHVNQEGYMPGYAKKAFIGYYTGNFGELSIPTAGGFSLVDANTGATVYTGTLTARPDVGYTYSPTPYQAVLEADFTSFNTAGEYKLVVPNLGASVNFLIDEGIAMSFVRAYALGLYHQRCGAAHNLPYTRHTHGVCHAAAAAVPIPQSSFSYTWTTIASKSADYANNPRHTAPQLASEATQRYPFVRTGNIDVSLGHHDAGDYSKYTINVALLIHYLVWAADNIANAGALDNLGIPESSDGKSDLLQEAKWEADFLAKMQDSDGGFYFLVYPRNRAYEDNVTPDFGDPQVVWPKTTAATAAAVAALAEIASSPRFKQQFPTESAAYMQKATAGWNFLINAINTWGKDGSYQKITHYGDEFMHDDELAWAAAAMYAATGTASYQTKLFEWFPNPNDPATFRWGWWRLFDGYGQAVRAYGFAAKSGRLTQAQLNTTYFQACTNQLVLAANDAYNRYVNTAYGTSFPSENKSYRSAGWYFSSPQAFDMVAGYQFNPSANYVTATIANMNYEGGGNPVNVTYMTGLGSRRQRDIVHQYAQNDRRVLPPSGIPLGAIQSGFAYIYTYGSELGALTFPHDGATTAPYPFYDRWGDTFNVSTEFVVPDMTRGIAALSFLAVQSNLRNQVWRSANGSITVPTAPSIYSPVTSTFAATGMDLSQAILVWEGRSQEPAFGGNYTFVPTSAGEYWVEGEATWPDGRRVFAANNIAVTDPNGGSEYANDANTIALYHFNGNYNDSSGNLRHLTPAGNVTLSSANLGWMKTQSGQVARMSAGGDKLTVSIPDSAVMPGTAATALTIEAQIYPRAYKAYNVANYSIVELYQEWDSHLVLYDGIYNNPANPHVAGPSGAMIVSAATWAANVAKDQWHDFRLTFDTAGVVRCYVDGKLLGSATVSLNVGRSSNWNFTLGNFDGDIDEVRISKVLRANPLPNVSVVATDPNAAEAAQDKGLFTVFRSGNKDAALAVNLSVGGTAANGTDYSAIATSATIPAGAASTTINVTPVNDTTSESSETVTLAIAANAAYGIGNANATVTIADNDAPPATTVSLAATDASAAEAASNTGVFTFTRTGSTSGALTVNYSISGAAANSADYNTLATGVTIAAGAASATVTVTPVEDSAVEGSETVVLTVASGTGYTVGSPNSATVTIADNDTAPPPSGGAGEFAVDANTVALYHLNGNFNDATPNGYNLTVDGTVTFAANAGWMATPSGQVARFANVNDKLTVAIPDSVLMSVNAPLTIEARVFPRAYKAYSIGNFTVVGLDQDWDTTLNVVDGAWNNPKNPSVLTCSGAVLCSLTQWQSAVPLNAWSSLRITYSPTGGAACYINDTLIATANVTMNVSRVNNWTVTLGNFDGDIDEVRVSKVVRTAGAPPAAPSGLIAAAVSTTQIDLTWTDASSNEAGFKVERSTDNNTFTEVASLAANAISYSNTGLTANTRYYYRIRAYTSGGDSAASSVTSATTFAHATTVVAKRVGGGVTIDGNLSEAGWNLNTSITKALVGAPNNTSVCGVMWDDSYLYVAFRITDSALRNDSTSSWDDDAVEVYIDGNHNHGASYDTFDRQFVKGWNDSAFWEKNNNTTGVQHAWAAVTGGYAVELAIPWSSLGVTAAADKTIGFDAAADDDDNGAGRDSQQMWSGTNNNWTDTSAFGDLYLSPLSAPSAPAAPGALLASSASTTQIDLSWADNSGNETGFRIERSTDNVSFTEIATVGANVISYSNTALVASTKYYYRVKSYNALGTSAASQTAFATTFIHANTAVAKKAGSITIDGALSEASWTVNRNMGKTLVGTPNNVAEFGVLWDTTYLYVAYRVTDSALQNDSVSSWDDDAVELYIDGNHNHGTLYDSFDRQYVKGWNDSPLWEKNNLTTGVLHAWAAVAGGYTVELAIPWTNLGVTSVADLTIGFDAAMDDDDNAAGRDSQLMWQGTNNNWTDTSAFGDLYLSSFTGP